MLAHLLRAQNLAEEMERRRAVMRALYGARYEAKIEPLREILRRVVARDGKPIMETVLDLCKKADAAGHGAITSLLVAAGLDLIDAAAAEGTH